MSGSQSAPWSGVEEKRIVEHTTVRNEALSGGFFTKQPLVSNPLHQTSFSCVDPSACILLRRYAAGDMLFPYGYSRTVGVISSFALVTM